jgi:hypothetical protein
MGTKEIAGKKKAWKTMGKKKEGNQACSLLTSRRAPMIDNFPPYHRKTSTNTEETSGHITVHRCWRKLILKAFSKRCWRRCRTREAMAMGDYVQLMRNMLVNVL